jgi:hypothetical protein
MTPQELVEGSEPKDSNSSAIGTDRVRTEIIARVREADLRAREAEEKARQIEAKFKQEQALRLLAEQRVVEIEEEARQRLASAQGADFSRLEMELVLAETEAKLKQESEARWLAETVLVRAREEVKAAANSTALATEEAEKRLLEMEAELEARDRALEEKGAAVKSTTFALNQAERRIAELENRLSASARNGAAEAATRDFESLIRQADARAKEAEDKYEAAEVRLQFEIERRNAAEQKVQYIENDFRSDLELDWAKFEADIEQAEAAVRAREETIARTSAERARQESEELIQRLAAQLEAEQRSRKEIERRLTAPDAQPEPGKQNYNINVERKFAEMDAALKAANTARAEAERKLAELEKARAAEFERARHAASPPPAPRPVGAEPRARELEGNPRVPQTPIQKPPRATKPEPVKTPAKNSRRGGSSLLTLGLSSETPAPAPPNREGFQKNPIKLLGYGAAISLLLLILILTAYRLL